jgi:hypothetical protein
MIYHKIKFSNDYPVSEGYMEVDDNIGQLNRLTDIDGNTIPLEGLNCGYEVIDANPPRPIWVNTL